MLMRVALVALALVAAGCQRQDAAQGEAEPAPELDAPAPGSDSDREFQAVNDAAQAVGAMSVAITTRLPSPDQIGSDAIDILSLSTEAGLAIEAEVVGEMTPATQIGGDAIRTLMGLAAEESNVSVYRVANATQPQNGRGLCGADAPAYVVVWEPSAPGESGMKVMGVTGAAPGAAGARACPMLEYRRQ